MLEPTLFALLKTAVTQNIGFDKRVKGKFSGNAEGNFLEGSRHLQIYNTIFMRIF